MPFSCHIKVSTKIDAISGAIIIFTSVLARVFIRRKLPLYKWAAVLITTVGIVVVGLADILPNPLDKNYNLGVSDDFNNTSYALSAFHYKSSMFSLGKFHSITLFELRTFLLKKIRKDYHTFLSINE